METCLPEEVQTQMKDLLNSYHSEKNKTIEDVIDFHYKFECLHPFQDGNGRAGRLIIFKECLANNIVPFIIDEDFLMVWGHCTGLLKRI
jgi:Fic family protein